MTLFNENDCRDSDQGLQPEDFHFERGDESGSGKHSDKSTPHVKASFETSDILALACLILAIGAVIVAVLVIVHPPQQLAGQDIVKIVIACVGTAGISGLAAAGFRRRGKSKGK